MAKWTFDPAVDSTEIYADGTSVPHRKWIVRLDGVPIGELELHCHKRFGVDGKIDVSYGLTAITYGPPPSGKIVLPRPAVCVHRFIISEGIAVCELCGKLGA